MSDLSTHISWHRTWGIGRRDGTYKKWSGPTLTVANVAIHVLS